MQRKRQAGLAGIENKYEEKSGKRRKRIKEQEKEKRGHQGPGMQLLRQSWNMM